MKIHLLFYRIALSFSLFLQPAFAVKEVGFSLKKSIQPKYTPASKRLSYALDRANKGGDLSMSVGKIDFNTFNPYLFMAWPAEGCEALHATLMFQPADDQTNLYPYLIRAFEREKTQIRFYLREEATFSDGSHVKAEDVRYSFDLLKKNGLSEYQAVFEDITVEQGATEHEVIFKSSTLSQEQIFQVALMPVFKAGQLHPHVLEKPIVSGPYQVDEFDKNQYVTYKKRENWWGETLWFNQNLYNFDRVKVFYVPNPEVNFQSFKQKTYLLRRELNVQWWHNRYESLQKKGLIQFEIKPNMTQKVAGIFFNTQNPFLSNRRIRAALRSFFDFDSLNTSCYHASFAYFPSVFWDEDLISFFAQKTEQIEAILRQVTPQPAGTSDTHRVSMAAISETDFNAIVQAAGWRYEKGKLVNAVTKERAQLTIVGLVPYHKLILQGWVRKLETLGIDVIIKMVSPGEYYKRMNSGRYDLLIVNGHFYFDLTEGLASLWLPNLENAQNTNLSHVHDPALIDFIERLRKAETLTDQKILMGAIDRYTYQQAYYIPMWSRRFFYMAAWVPYRFPDSKYGQSNYMTWSAG